MGSIFRRNQRVLYRFAADAIKSGAGAADSAGKVGGPAMALEGESKPVDNERR